jgi:class 3 adenylate cyclase
VSPSGDATRDRASGRFLTTVLFTDIVGSTDLARELGDKRWQALIAGHHAVVRRELKRFGGRERDTAGDGFFATFDQPASAVRCAFEIVHAVRDLGIEIRAGVHTGEVELSAGEVRGIAVHLGARVMSRAGAGEVLVSSTTRDLIAGSGVEVTDRGVHRLKGLEVETRLFGVEAIEGEALAPPLDAEEAAGRRDRVAVIEPPSSRRRAVGMSLAGVALAAVVSTVLLTRGGDAPSSSPTRTRTPGATAPVRNAVVAIDPATGDIVHVTPDAIVPSGGGDPRIAVGEGAVWVRSSDLVVLDPTSGDVEDRLRSVGDLEPGTSLSVGVGSRAVWIPAGAGLIGGPSRMLRFDPATAAALPTIQFAGDAAPTDVAVADGATWVTFANGDVRELNQDTGVPEGVVHVDGNLDAVAVGPGAVWVLDEVAAVVTRIDPATREIIDAISVTANPRAMVADEHGVWILDTLANTVTQVAANTDEARPSIGLGIDDPHGIAAGLGAIWVADGGGELIRIDAVTGQTAPLDVGVSLDAIAIGAGSDLIWLGVGPA